MNVIRSHKHWKDEKKPLAIAMGNFDGIHLGHQTILKKMVRRARRKKWTPCVYTFDPHPAKVLAPKTAPLLLQTLEQKLSLLEQLEIEGVILEKFDPHFSLRTPKDFFQKILVDQLNAKGVWVGYDFTFGVKRSGNIALLERLCKNKKIELFVTQPQFKRDTLVSSTQIRELVRLGQMKLASELLGRPFALIGKVVKGKGLGGKLGIHTANLHVENELLPRTGIYITQTRILRSTIHPSTKLRAGDPRSTKYWPSATSVGFNPTFPGKGFSVETHLIGFKGDLQGEKIEVEFLEWLRDELTFPNAQTLATQIRKDIEDAKKFYQTFRDYR